MDRLSHIVAGVDFSACSLDALAQAKRIASWNRAQVSALHVIDTLVVLDLQEALSQIAMQIQDGLVEDARTQWKALALEYAWLLDISFECVVNNAVAELTRRSAPTATRSALLILGVHGQGRSTWAGSVAAGCVRHAHCPVLLVREGKRERFSHVVACVDFSDTSKEAVDAAIRVAAQDEAKLHVVHVHTPPRNLLGFVSRTQLSTLDAAAARNQVRERLHAFCNTLGSEALWSNAQIDVVDHAHHGQGIIEYVKGVDADLVVLGVRGRTNLRDLLMGATAERVVRDAPCAVLTVRPPEVK